MLLPSVVVTASWDRAPRTSVMTPRHQMSVSLTCYCIDSLQDVVHSGDILGSGADCGPRLPPQPAPRAPSSGSPGPLDLFLVPLSLDMPVLEGRGTSLILLVSFRFSSVLTPAIQIRQGCVTVCFLPFTPATPVPASTVHIQNVPREAPGRAGPASGPGPWDRRGLADRAVPAQEERSPSARGGELAEGDQPKDRLAVARRKVFGDRRPEGRRGEGSPVTGRRGWM